MSKSKQIFEKQIEDYINNVPANESGFVRVKEPLTGAIVKTGATGDLKARIGLFNSRFKLVRSGEHDKLPHLSSHRYQVYIQLGGYFTFEYDLMPKNKALDLVKHYEDNGLQIVSNGKPSMEVA